MIAGPEAAKADLFRRDQWAPNIVAGAILILLGMAKFGGVPGFVPDPVIAGFTDRTWVSRT